MIKNINDLISAIVLLILFVSSIRFFIWTFINRDDEDKTKVNKWQLIKEYIDNEEE